MGTPATPRLSPRYTWSLVALVTGIVLAPVAFVAHHTVVLATDTDRVAATVEPLLETPAVQSALVGSITGPLEDLLTTDDILQRIADSAGLGIEVPGLLDDALTALLQPIVDRTLEEVRAGIAQVIASEPFAKSWRQIVSDTHTDMSELLTAESYTPGSELTLSLRPFLADIRDGLVDRGFDFVEAIPLPAIRITLLGADTVESLRGWVQAAQMINPWALGLSGALIAAGVVASPRRENAWAIAGGGVALGMVSIVVTLWLVRTVWIPLQFPRSSDIAQPIADALMRYPITQAILVGVIAATVGAVGWLVESRIRGQRVMTEA
jgi:hypothetical protein